VDEVEPGLREGAHPADVSRVLGDFRLEEDNMDHRATNSAEKRPNFSVLQNGNAGAFRVENTALLQKACSI
jgi:hypothetical protein